MSYMKIPTWEKGKWSYTEFSTKEEFRDFILTISKEPGKYQFDKTSSEFNSQARLYQLNKRYCAHAYMSKDYIKYWDFEKEKCISGAIFISGSRTWYLTREYYMWINFLPLFNKEKNKFIPADVRDAQYHMALYELLAELHGQHGSVLKKRQIASSYYHMAKAINLIWFEEGPTIKIGASDKSYVKASWVYAEEYRNFLNENTAWFRNMDPGKFPAWEQKLAEKKQGNRWTTTGLKGQMKALSFEQDPALGVGGPCRYFFHEEGGIAPDAGESYIYVRQAMRSGQMVTGFFVIAGSVGDLDQCEPLKDFILNPVANQMYGVQSNLIDSQGTTGITGLFIPEQWSMVPFIDEYGNSLVEEALEALNAEFAQLKKDLTPEKYQLEISQRPRNIEEAFAYRKQSKFPIHLLHAQKKRIDEKEYPMERLEIFRDENGFPAVKETNKLPIIEFPVTKNMEDKESCVQVWERPIPNPGFGTYYASIDPVSEGKTVTSESLCSIYIYKNDIQVTRMTPDGPETVIEHGKIVAASCFRYNDINKTHERLSLMLEWYNAWAVLENNISLFTQYMISKHRQRYLVPKGQIMFLKDIGANQNIYQEYGWKNAGDIFKRHLLSYAIESLSEELDVQTKPDGTIVKVTFGVERIPDPMLLREMLEYVDGLNVDRLVAFCALMAFVKVQQSNRGYIKRVEDDVQTLEKSPNFGKLNKQMFTHIGRGKSNKGQRPPRNPFKNLH
jgi:hypothetical protein